MLFLDDNFLKKEALVHFEVFHKGIEKNKTFQYWRVNVIIRDFISSIAIRMRFQDMSQEQQIQVRRQVAQFNERFANIQNGSATTDIILTPEFVLNDYILNKDVFQSDKMTAVEFARWIAYNNGEYFDKIVMDMCCGGGIQGIVALLRGARHVTFVDYSEEACQNTLENIVHYGLEDKADVIQSDLFKSVKTKTDLIVVNPPFFPGEPLEDEPISRTMCFGEEKAHELYREAKRYAPKMAVCHWDLAGRENDPENLGPKYGWNVTRRLFLPTGYGLQQVSGSDKEYHFKVDVLER